AVGRNYAATMPRLELGDAAGVVGMMVRHQDVGELPAHLGQRSLDRRGLRRIDRRGGAALGVMQQHAVIVLQAGKQMSLRMHGPYSSVSCRAPDLENELGSRPDGAGGMAGRGGRSIGPDATM